MPEPLDFEDAKAQNQQQLGDGGVERIASRKKR